MNPHAYAAMRAVRKALRAREEAERTRQQHPGLYEEAPFS